MTYKEAQRIFKEKYGVIPKSSWIADIRSENGKTKEYLRWRGENEPKWIVSLYIRSG